MAQRFDVERAALVGDPMTVATAVACQGNFGVGAFSVSDTGVIAYRAGGASRQLVWLDRSGRELGVVGAADEAGLLDVELSRDGRRAVVTRTLQRNRDLWLVDLARSAVTRFTFDAREEETPTWSPDGNRIAFVSNRADVADVYVKPSSGAGNEEPLWTSQREKRTNDWSPDGRFLLYEEAGVEGR